MKSLLRLLSQYPYLPVTSMLMTLAVPAVILACLGACPGFLLRAVEFLAGTLLFVIEVIAEM